MSRPAIEVEHLRLAVRGRPLLEDAALRVPAGELCLLVGASGTGKTLTLAMLSGLLRSGPEVELRGEVRVLGLEVLARPLRAAVPGTGIVFQDFALIDDLDARENILFGLDHGTRDAQERERLAEALLEEFRLPARIRPAAMSGGMKQRLAIARTMAFGAELVLYDEPTSGLDPAMSRQVARRIREVHERHHTTSLVVTHDLASLQGIADRIVLLDAGARRFREVARDEVDEALETLQHHRPAGEAPQPRRSTLHRMTVGFLEGAGGFAAASVATAASLLPRYPVPRWGLRFLWTFLRLTTLGSALPFLAMAGLISGFITTYFMFSLLPLQGFTEPVLVEEFIGSLGYALYRVVVPGITTLLFASRSGAAIAADIGNRVLTRQVDALRSLGVPPSRYLLTGLTLASAAGIPLLFLVAVACARVAAVGVFLATHPGHGAYAFSAEFDRLLGSSWGGLPGGTAWVLAKLLLSALGTAGIAYHTAMAPKGSGADVARGVTATIIRATVFILVVHLVFAFFEF